MVRVKVDPTGALTPEQLSTRQADLATAAAAAGLELIDNNLAALPPSRREVEVLMTGTDAAALQDVAMGLCANAFGTEPVAGVVTFVSHGTDEDAAGVLA